MLLELSGYPATRAGDASEAGEASEASEARGERSNQQVTMALCGGNPHRSLELARGASVWLLPCGMTKALADITMPRGVGFWAGYVSPQGEPLKSRESLRPTRGDAALNDPYLHPECRRLVVAWQMTREAGRLTPSALEA